jgi:hypothetical protein
MSWAIEESMGSFKEGNNLRDWLQEAQKQNILMFCSSCDQGIFSSSTRKFYPHVTNSCIKIGAAGKDGFRCKWVDEDVDFLLPGKDIPFTWQRSESTNAIWSESGSSLATALAAGLAANLIYAYRAVEAVLANPASTLSTGSSPNAKKSSRGESIGVFDIRDINTSGTMSNMFKQLTDRESTEVKYVQAGIWFSKRLLGYVAEEDPEGGELDSAGNMEKYFTELDDGPDSVPELMWMDATRRGLVKLLTRIRKRV